MKKTANKQVICQVLMEAAKTDRNIVALCSDSRGSGSFGPFADAFPEQFVETGIAEQNMEEISIHKHMARRSRRLIVLADSSKFSRSASFHAYHFEEISSIITDDQLDEEIARKYRKSGVDLIIA